MATYSDLALEHYYLVKETEDSDITLVQPAMQTGKCLLVLQIDDEVDFTYWRKKDDTIFEIVEELTDEQVEEYDNLFEEDDDLEAWDVEEPGYEFEEEELLEEGGEEAAEEEEEE